MLIIVAEPNTNQRERLHTLLSEAGYQVVVASNGAAARALVQPAALVVLLANTHLPDMQGSDLVQSLRDAATAAHLYAILLAPAPVAVSPRSPALPFSPADDCLGLGAPDADILNRVALGARMLELQHQLRTLASERQRSEADLIQARDAAEAASRSKSEFLANTSHEIRNPLNAVLGMTTLLLDTPLTAEQRDYAETIRSSSDTLLSLINDVLDFSKIESGRLEIEQQPFNLHHCIEEAMDQLATQASAKELELLAAIDPQAPLMLLGDVTRVRQIVMNLLSNAIKFTRAGEVVVAASAEQMPVAVAEQTTGAWQQDDQPTYLVHIDVHDTGIGIAPDHLSRLFRSFSQADTSTTRLYGGTGLGLSISRRLAELMGGTIRAESELDKGSTFYVTFQAQQVYAEQPPYSNGVVPQLKGKRVLIVKANATARNALADQVRLWGMQPRTFASNAAALQHLNEAGGYDVALLDLFTPEHDTIQVAAELRADNRFYTMPLVLISPLGYQVDSETLSLFAAPLTRPIKASVLYETLLGVLVGNLADPRPRSRKPVIDRQMGRRMPLRILMAEDNPVNQKVTLKLLEKLGYTADVVSNGLEALEALAHRLYDVILMDIQMPRMEGVETTRRIRGRSDLAQQPHIIALTAHAVQGDRERYLAMGMDYYLSKPIQLEALMVALRNAVPPARRVVPRMVEDEPPTPVAAAPAAAQTSEANASTSPGLIDWKVLQDYVAVLGDVGASATQELVDLYLENTPVLISRLRSAVAEENASEAVRAAHDLGSTSASLGAMELAKLARALERQLRYEPPANTEEKVAELARMYEQVLHELSDYQNRLFAGS